LRGDTGLAYLAQEALLHRFIVEAGAKQRTVGPAGEGRLRVQVETFENARK
jgi:hypothetical protein